MKGGKIKMNRKEELKSQIKRAEESIKFFEGIKSEWETELKTLDEQEEQGWQYGDDYWFINLDTMHMANDIWHDTLEDDIRLKRKLIFKTSDEVEEYLEYLQAKEKAMNEFSNAEWEDEDINKYYIYYDCEDNFFRADYSYYCRRINEMYFRTKESAQEFIDKYEKHLRRELCV